MRIIIQRVLDSSVTIDGKVHASIGKGMTILVGIEDSDTEEDIDWLCKKIVMMRIFDDENGVMNRSIIEDGGDILVISQFTLYASTKKGNRPSYIRAAKPEISITAIIILLYSIIILHSTDFVIQQCKAVMIFPLTIYFEALF